MSTDLKKQLQEWYGDKMERLVAHKKKVIAEPNKSFSVQQMRLAFIEDRLDILDDLMRDFDLMPYPTESFCCPSCGGSEAEDECTGEMVIYTCKNSECKLESIWNPDHKRYEAI